MSSGMLLLAGLFATGPAAAQPELAPMPRAKSARVAVEFRIDLSPRGLSFGAGVGSVKPMLPPSTGTEAFRNSDDASWPERYSTQSRAEVLAPFAQQVNNGHVQNQTVWNWFFEAGTDKLTSAGRAKLDAIARALPSPDPRLYLQTARDVAVTDENVDRVKSEREALTQKRVAAIQKHMAAQPAVGTALGYQVLVHDAPPPAPPVERIMVDAGHGLRIHVPAMGPNPCPSSCPPPEVHAMMLQTFGQMGAPVPQTLPMPQTYCPPVLHPAAHAASWTAPVPPSSSPEGTWTRTVGPVRYKLEVKAKTLTVTTTLTEEDDDGKVTAIDHVLTADWYPTRNANEIVGLVTGFDIAMHDKTMSRDEASGLLASLATIQKQLSGKPLALTWRMHDGTLAIGDVRFPELKDQYEELSSALAALGGNYQPTRPSVLMPVTPASMTVPAFPQSQRFGGMVIPSPRYLKHQPQYFPDDPTFPLPRELRSQEPGERIGIDFNLNPPRRTGLPPMPLPTPLPNPFRNGGR